MTDSIAIPSSSSSSHARQEENQRANNSNAAPSTPVTPNMPEHSNSFYGSSMSMSLSESSRASSSPSLQATNGSRIQSSGSGESLISKEAEHSRKLSAREKGKMPLRSRELNLEGRASASPTADYERRTSFLSSSLSKSEHTVVNIGEPDRPRLITCVKASQGFDWNQEIFLPSYISDRNYMSDLERKQDPVEDIFITDEEAEMMFPR